MKSLILTGFLILGAIAPFTERGTTDFDTFLGILNPYGIWKMDPNEKKWGFSPLSSSKTPSFRPFSSGRWIYTDYGWNWVGTDPHSWCTGHYGYWKRIDQNQWLWFASPDWHSNPVDWRGTSTHIGWRPSPLNKMGDFVEAEEKRVAHPEEWIFVKKEDFEGSITPNLIVKETEVAALLLDSYPLSHEAQLYRAIPRAGPDPTLFSKTLPQKNPAREIPESRLETYLTMALPSFWFAIPATAKPYEIYLYRPKIFQDNEGIQRRIRIWMNVEERSKNALEKIHR